MVSGIKPRTFENNLGGGDDLLKCFLAALGAGLERGILKGLLALELDATILTAVGINRHTDFLLLYGCNAGHYSLQAGQRQACGAACYNFLTISLVIARAMLFARSNPAMARKRNLHPC